MEKSNTPKTPSLGALITESQMAEAKPKPSILDTQCRDNFIAIALREIVAWQWAESKVNEAQAAAIAVRYANEAMAARGNMVNPTVVVAKGAKTDAVPQLPLPPLSQGQITDKDGNVVGQEKPKTIAEIIGEAEPVAELK